MNFLSDEIIERVSEEIKRINREVIMPVYDGTDPIAVEYKSEGQGDVVTATDRKAEEILTAFLKDLVPGSEVIGEETIGMDFLKLERSQKRSGVVWTVDPIDGTDRFRKRQSGFATMGACSIDGVTLHAWMFLPKLENGAVMLSATAGQGTFIEYANGVRERVCPPSVPFEEHSFGYDGLNRQFEHIKEEARLLVQKLEGHIAGTYTHNCIAADTYDMLMGGNKGIIYLCPKLWDALPPSLIIREAGGFAGPLENPDIDMYGYNGTDIIYFGPDKNKAEMLKAVLRNPDKPLLSQANALQPILS